MELNFEDCPHCEPDSHCNGGCHGVYPNGEPKDDSAKPAGEPWGYINQPRPWSPHHTEQVVKVTRKPQPEYGFTLPVYLAAAPAPAEPSRSFYNEIFRAIQAATRIEGGGIGVSVQAFKDELARRGCTVVAPAEPASAPSEPVSNMLRDAASLIAKGKSDEAIALLGRIDQQLSRPAMFVTKDSEAEWIKSTEHLNCPLCTGSGHVEDAERLQNLWKSVADQSSVLVMEGRKYLLVSEAHAVAIGGALGL